MIHETWLPNAVAVDVRNAATLSISAQIAEDRSVLRLLATNNLSTAVEVKVTLGDWNAKPPVTMTTLSASLRNASNPPGIPDLISPKVSELRQWDGTHSFPPLSVSVLQFHNGNL